MSPPFDSAFLSAMVWSPSVGSLGVSLLGSSRSKFRRALALGSSGLSLLLATFAWLALPDDSATLAFGELRSWIPSLGISYDIGMDGLSASLVAWLALVTPLALGSLEAGRCDRRTTALVLVGETMLLGLFVARDAFLLLAFLGGAVVAATLLVAPGLAMRRYFFFQSAGLALLLGFFVLCFHRAHLQAGFPTAELSRWAGLVLDSSAATRLALLGTGAAALALPLFPFTSWLRPVYEATAAPGRIFLTGGLTLAPGYVLFRLVVSSLPQSERWLVTLVLVAATASLAYAALAARSDAAGGWVPLIVGYQAMVVAGLLSFEESATMGGALALLHLATGMTALSLWTLESEPERRTRPPVVAKLMLAPVVASLLVVPGFLGFVSVGRILAGHWDRSPAMTGLLGVGFAMVLLRVARTVPFWMGFAGGGWRRKLVLLLPVVVCCVWMGWGASRLELRLRSSIAGLFAAKQGSMAGAEDR